MAMNSFTVRGRETGREEAILQQSTISDCGQTTNGWKVLEKKKEKKKKACLPHISAPGAAS